MQDDIASELFSAIKGDDLRAFEKHMIDPSAKDISFGRFPLLTLCYMYNANKIINRYESVLIKVNNYTRIDENIEMYLKFKSIAHRVLRLYVGDNKIVSPLEMLCILGKASKLEALYPTTPKNALIIENIKLIEQIKTSRVIDIGETRIVMPKQPMTKKAKTMIIASCAIAVLMVFICVGVIFGVQSFGIGTEEKPYVVYNAKQFNAAIATNSYVILGADIEVEAFNLEKFDGVLNGNGYTLTIVNQNKTLVDELNGTIENITIKTNVNISTLLDLGLLTKKNKGTIDKVTMIVSGQITYSGTATTTSVTISPMVVDNDASITNTTVVLDLNAKGNKTTDVLFGGIAGNNDGTIENATVEGQVNLDHINGASIVCENAKDIKNSQSSLNIYQTTEISNASLMICGIAVVNTGDIDSCEYSGSLVVENKNTSGVYVYMGGIAGVNYATISNCKFKGSIKADTAYSATRLGGIVAQSEYFYSDKTPKIESCGSEGSMTLLYDDTRSFAYIGGILGYVESNCTLNKNFFIGTISNPSEGQLLLVGGICGLWNGYNTLQNNAFINNNETLHGLYYFYSYFYGYQYADDIEGLIKGYSSIDSIKALEIYWE